MADHMPSDADREEWPELEPMTEAECEELYETALRDEARRSGWTELYIKRTGDDRP